VNHIEISGRMCRDPELKHIGTKGTKLANFSIALTMGEGQYKKAHYFDCKAWSLAADGVVTNYRKGDAIEVRGMIQQETWTDKDGQKRSKIVIVVLEHRTPGARDSDDAQPERKPAARKPDPGAYVPQVPMDDLQIPF